MYSQLKCQVSATEGMSECFSQDNGVFQGESLSPTLFTAYINELESIMNAIDGMGVNINGVNVSVLMIRSRLHLWLKCVMFRTLIAITSHQCQLCLADIWHCSLKLKMDFNLASLRYIASVPRIT